MKAGRSYFSPCKFHRLVYLCGQGSYLIEAFDPSNNLFLDMEVTLPEAGLCLTFQEREELVVLSGKFLTRWRVGQDGELVQCYQALHPDVGVFCNMAPVVDQVNGLVYIADMGVCYSVKVDGSERTEVAN